MLKYSGKRETERGRHGDTGMYCERRRVSVSPCLRVAFVLLCLLFSAGCRRDMQDQPKAKPYRSSTFFKNGLSSRMPVEGTIARGWLRADTELFTGKKSKTQGSPTSGVNVAGASSLPAQSAGSNANPQFASVRTTPTANASASQVAAAYPDDVDKFPFPLTQEILDRGQERFQIFCSVCHGMTGNADGMVVRRGFRKPPSYHEQRLREAPVGHFFDVVTNGWGAMPSYATQVPVQDRWAIIAYLRALQLTQANTQPATQSNAPAAPAKNAGGTR